MIRFRNLSIKTKLVSIQLITTTLVLFFFMGIYIAGQYRQYEDASFRRMSMLSEILGSNSVSALLFFDNTAAEDVLASLSTQADILNAAIYDHTGKLFARYDQNTEYTFIDTSGEVRTERNQHFILRQKITFDDLRVGWIAMRLDPSTQRERVIGTLLQSFFIFFFGLVLAAVLSIRAQKPISDSILSLSRFTQRVRDTGNYSLRVISKSRDEVGTLVTGINTMMEKISDSEKHLEELVAARTIELEEAKTRAEESDHLKSAFLASMSHELRTPLNSIIGFSGILLQELAGPLTAEQKKQLGMVKSSSSHLLELINDVLDISRIESGRVQVVSELFKIDLVLIMTISTLRPFAEKKGLTLDYELEPDLPEMHSDKRRVEQILINLINNAIKFTETGSIRVLCARQGDSLVIKVVDSGIGIKNNDQEAIFNTFRQVDSGLTRVKEGSGLGLAICKKLTELLGGTISVHSDYGAGSTFKVILPFNREEQVDEY